MLLLHRLLAIALIGIVAASAATAEELLELNRSFVEKYKNRLTIDAKYIVDAAHKKPNAPKKDGDMHVAGRAAEIGLATVAEIQNAKEVPDALQIIRDVEGSDRKIAVTGVWRIWPKHGGETSHKQRNTAGPKYTGTGPTNPPHVFEIHPVLQIEDQQLHATLKPIDGFPPKDARTAFTTYERGFFEIKATPEARADASADGRIQLCRISHEAEQALQERA